MGERVFVIGAGRVGQGLTKAFRLSGVQVVGLHARRIQPAYEQDDALSIGEYPPTIADANIILIAVRDAEINGVCQSLAALAKEGTNRLAHGTVILHTSGAVEPPAYATLRALGFAAGTFHPLIPFATPDRGANLVPNSWVGIDGDATACAASRRLAAAVGARTVNIPPHGKAAYHAAAVIASNFPIVLAAVASDVLADAGVAGRTAEQVVQSLMSAAVGNLEHGAPHEVLTGPAVRGDVETMQSHRQALRHNANAVSVYDVLSKIAMTLASQTSHIARETLLLDDSRFGRGSEDKPAGGD